MTALTALFTGAAVMALALAWRPRRRRLLEPRPLREHIPPRPDPRKRQRLLVAAGGMGLAFTVAYTVYGDALLAGVMALGGILAPRWWFARQERQRRRLLTEQLERLLVEVAASLRAGATARDALRQAAAGAPDPLGPVLRRGLARLAAGYGLEEVLDEVGEQLRLRPWTLLVTAVALHGEVGGNLAEVLDQISHSVRQQRAFRSTLEAATAQGRYSTYVVAAMPFVVYLMMRLMSPEYAAPLHTPLGRVVLLVAAALVAGGFWLVQRTVRIELDD